MVQPSTAWACGSTWPGGVEESHAGAGRFLQQAPGVLPAGARAAMVPNESPQEKKLQPLALPKPQKIQNVGF